MLLVHNLPASVLSVLIFLVVLLFLQLFQLYIYRRDCLTHSMGLFGLACLRVVRHEQLHLGLQTSTLKLARKESSIRVWEKLVPVEREAHQVRYEPGPFLADKRLDLPGRLLLHVHQQPSLVLVNVVTVHVVGNKVGFATC